VAEEDSARQLLEMGSRVLMCFAAYQGWQQSSNNMDDNKRAAEPAPTKRTRVAASVHLRTESHADSVEWQAVLRIINSHGFTKSTLLTNFLRYVCERKLQGRDSEITEQQIGTHALGRPATYNPGDDNIVRNYARILRQRLEDFYADEGREEPLRIVISRGSYVPRFEPQPLAQVQELHEALPQASKNLPSHLALPPQNFGERSATQQPRWGSRIPRIPTIIALALLVAMATYAGRRAWLTTHPDVYTEFWNEVLTPHRSTVVVLADSGIGILQDFTGVRIRLHDYASGDTSALSAAFAQRFSEAPFGIDRFKNLTSTADTHSLLSLVALPQFAATNPRVRSAQEVQMDDLSGSNAIIVGGPRANPWVELYEPASDFRLEIPGEFRGSQLDARVVINKSPHTGEATRFSNGFHADEGYVNHSILSFLPSLDGHGHALLFQGGNMGATQAAADFATDRLSMDPILKNARRPDGTLRPFEVLLETRVIGASSPKAEVLLVHYK
jgi:hypothetical protein